jgi:hypothetical protein
LGVPKTHNKKITTISHFIGKIKNDFLHKYVSEHGHYDGHDKKGERETMACRFDKK